MDNVEYFNRYMASVTSSRDIITSAMSLLERQDDMLRLMYLNWIDPYEEEPSHTPIHAHVPLRRRTGWGTHSPVYRTVMRNSTQFPLNTRGYRENLRRQQNSSPVRSRNLDNNNQPDDNSISNIFAQAILNNIGNMNQLSPVVVRPTQRTIDLATENIMFSEIPANIDRYQQCPISHENFQPNTPITRIRRCRHYFERDSIATWFQTSCRCPICRADIREGITDDTTHNEAGVDESDDDNTSNDVDNSVAENTNDLNIISNVQINRNIAELLGMVSSAGEPSDFPSSDSGPNSQRFASGTNMFRRTVGDHRTTFSRSDPSGNNLS